jgi:hypothetical protein
MYFSAQASLIRLVSAFTLSPNHFNSTIYNLPENSICLSDQFKYSNDRGSGSIFCNDQYIIERNCDENNFSGSIYDQPLSNLQEFASFDNQNAANCDVAQYESPVLNASHFDIPVSNDNQNMPIAFISLPIVQSAPVVENIQKPAENCYLNELVDSNPVFSAPQSNSVQNIPQSKSAQSQKFEGSVYAHPISNLVERSEQLDAVDQNKNEESPRVISNQAGTIYDHPLSSLREYDSRDRLQQNPSNILIYDDQAFVLEDNTLIVDQSGHLYSDKLYKLSSVPVCNESFFVNQDTKHPGDDSNDINLDKTKPVSDSKKDTTKTTTTTKIGKKNMKNNVSNIFNLKTLLAALLLIILIN